MVPGHLFMPWYGWGRMASILLHADHVSGVKPCHVSSFFHGVGAQNLSFAVPNRIVWDMF